MRDTHRNLGGAGNREEVITLREYPGECDLAWCGTMPVRNGLDTVDDLEYVREILGREPWKLTTRVSWLKIVWGGLAIHVVSCDSTI